MTTTTPTGNTPSSEELTAKEMASTMRQLADAADRLYTLPEPERGPEREKFLNALTELSVGIEMFFREATREDVNRFFPPTAPEGTSDS